MHSLRGGDSPAPGGGRGAGGTNGATPINSGRRRKKKAKGGKEVLPRERGVSEGLGNKPPPMILSKAAGLDNTSQDSERTPVSERSQRDHRTASPSPPIKIKLRDREDPPSQSHTPTSTTTTSSGSPSHSAGSPSSQTSSAGLGQGKQGSDGEARGRGGATTGRLYTPGQRIAGGQIPGISIEVPIHKRLAAPLAMTEPVRLVDNSFQWADVGSEYMLEQTDFLVIGVLGPQGCGKSTMMSLLAGRELSQPSSSSIFPPQTPSTLEQASHQTQGVEMFITPERVILLDTQPAMGAALLDRLLGPEKQGVPAEYSSPETYAEMQSLHIAAFLLTVCHVVIIAEDWFGDISLFQFLKRAEMLKPATPPPSSSQSENSNLDDPEDFVPNIVFVQNKASRESFQPIVVNAMQQTIHAQMATSKLKYTGCCSLARSSVMPCLNNKTLPLDLNFFLLPRFTDQSGTDQPDKAPTKSALHCYTADEGYVGHPKPDRLVAAFRNQLYAASRQLLIHSTLTEKNWYQYASRTWDGVKKSTLMSEYLRLVT